MTKNKKKSRRIPVVRQSDKNPALHGPKVSRSIYAASTRPGPFLIPTRKNPQGVVVAESFLESQFVIAADLDPRVRQIQTQPLVVDLTSGLYASTEEALIESITNHLLDAKQAWIWFPDFELLVDEDRQRILVEVKPHRFAQSDEVTVKQNAARAWATKHGWQHLLLTEVQLPQNLSSNLNALHTYLTQSPNIDLLQSLLTAFTQYGQLTARELCQHVGCEAVDVFVLLAHGLIEADLESSKLTQHTTPLGPASPSTLNVLPLLLPTHQ